MKSKNLGKLALALVLCGFTLYLQAQTNQPFSWKVTTDPWYMSQDYSFEYLPNEFTAKGKTTSGHGPVCSFPCKESTNPDACTEQLMNENLREVELPSFKLPSGYSGVEYVTFEVQTNSEVSNYQVVKQSVICPPCIQKAVNLVASLGEWYPAMQDGIFVKSKVVVPVYFKTNQSNQ
jgi:hypothetical protein